MAELPRKITDDPYGAAILIRRLVTEQGAAYWRRYLLAFALMAVSAATTAGSAYLLGQVINQAYVDKNVRGIAILSLVTIVIFTLKGAATYGHSVILSQISNAILANNQRRLFAKLMTESIAFYSDRHSSEFLARLTSGANSVTQVLSLLINAVGRDLLSLIALIFVMVTQDPLMSLLGLSGGAAGDARAAQAGEADQGPRAQPVHRHRRHHGNHAGIAAGHPHRQGVHARSDHARAHRRQHHAVERNANKMAHVSNRSSPLMETLGGFAIAGALMYAGYRVVAMGATPGQFFRS
jgi:ABC-type multidrug transport system fused ATPase/permease subunit